MSSPDKHALEVSDTPSTAAGRNTYQRKAPVLLVGRFLSRQLGLHGVCEDLAAQLKNSGWPVITTSEKAAKLPRFLDMIMTVWRSRNKYCVVNVDLYSGLAFVWAEIICKLLYWMGKPYVLTLHGGNLPTFAACWPSRVRRLLRSAKAVTAPSLYLYQQMGQYRPDVTLIPNPLDLRLYSFRLRVRPRPILVWLRAFHSVYNPGLAPQVLWRLTETFPETTLIMIGPDTGDGSLDDARIWAANFGVSGRISFIGKINKAEVATWMNMGDIFLNTTNADNTPVTVLEAMACGLCVVSTDVGGIPYLLENEHDSLLVPPGDSAAMAVAVTRVLTEPGLAARVSRNARQKARQFDWSVVLPHWELLFRSLAQDQMIAMEDGISKSSVPETRRL